MAFAQQQRRPTQQQQYSHEDDLCFNHDRTTSLVPSDSDNDWHVISSALPTPTNTSNTSTNNASPILVPTPTTSEFDFRPSDIESLATTTDHEELTDDQEEETSFLPSHDGTGTFVVEDVDFFSSDPNTTSQDESSSLEEEQQHSMTEFQSALQHISRADQSILDILMSKAPPSFAAVTTTTMPHFVPTVAGMNNSEELSVVSAAYYSDDNEKEQQQQRSNDLDQIPLHHPLPVSTSQVILSVVWDRLKRLTNHLIENDTNTVETISNLMSEAVLEGCIPFGSHLHMEINPRNFYSLLEVE